MIPLKKALMSSIGKKYVMGVTGLSLVGFMVTHLAANLTLYWPDPAVFNSYPAKLHAYGALLTAAELGLGALFATHAAMAFWLWSDKQRAAGDYFAGRPSKGGNSRLNYSSRNMIWTGGLLLAFVIAHVLHFRFGPGIAEGYTTLIDGEPARDLYRLVAEQFQDPVIAALYSIVMLFVGLHVRHGFWSAFQSLGAMKPEWSKGIYAIGAGVAFIFTIGFLFIPLWFYFDMPGRL